MPEAEGKVESDSAENSETHNPPAHVELEEEDSAFSKAKEILKRLLQGDFSLHWF